MSASVINPSASADYASLSFTMISATTAVAASSSSPSSSNTSSAAAAGAEAESTGMSTDELIVYWLDVAVLGVVAIFFLAALPRAVARFVTFSEWKRGLMLYGGSSVKRRTPGRSTSRADGLRRQNTEATLKDWTTDESHTLAIHEYSPEKTGKGDRALAGNNNNPPPHVAAMSSILYPVSSLFAYDVTPGKSVGKLTLAFLFVAAVVTLLFVLDGNPLTDSVRLGWIATGLIPVTIAFATKNNVIGTLLGMGYERLNFVHRWIGIVSFVTANLHVIGYLYKWAIKGTLSASFQKPYVIHGTIALVGIELLYFASLGWVRQKAYNFFLFAHIVGYCLFLIALCFHEEACIKWVVFGAGIYAFDHLLRLIKTRICTARIQAMPELGMVCVEVPSIREGWRAGQHVRLRVLSGEMGLVGWSVPHPFTIANVSGGMEEREGNGMTLLVKNAGSWTGRLYDAAGRAGYFPVESGYGSIREMKVIVEGPYGGMGHTIMASYSSVMLVGGGSGVTFVLGLAEELVESVRAGRSSIKFIEIVWTTQDQASVTPLLPIFTALVDSIRSLPGVLLKISIFYTRVSSSSSSTPKNLFSPPSPSSLSPLETQLAALAPALSLYAGRPNRALSKTLDGLVRLTTSLGSGRGRAGGGARGVGVAVCGPAGLAQGVRRVAQEVDGEQRSACGGVEVHEEVFGW